MKKRVKAINKPWLRFTGAPGENEVPNISMVAAMDLACKNHPDNIAIDYMGKKITYRELVRRIDDCARGFAAVGVTAGDSVLIALPNVPQAIIAMYALNRLGARACMAHPLSSATELAHYLSTTGSRVAVTLDMFFANFERCLNDGKIDLLISCSIKSHLPRLKKFAFALTKERKIKKPPHRRSIVPWPVFLAGGRKQPKPAHTPGDGRRPAMVLFSGGTTALPKGIELSSYNFNALTVGTKDIVRPKVGDSIVAILPIFHGFGLGLCIHTCLTCGVKAILVPEFSTKNYIACLIKHRPNFIAGVPTLFEALMRDPKFAKVSFAELKGAYCGGDSLPAGVKRRFDAAIRAAGSKVELKEGYGLTETVTAALISPDEYRPGSMGVPLTNNYAKIVRPGTTREVPPNTEGEICLAGPQTMLGYVGDPEGTAAALRKHSDGMIWMHTGDMGRMDDDGYFYFSGRYKRVLKVSGMSVFPEQVEQVLDRHHLVERSCVIGVPDKYQMASVKAFVVLSADAKNSGDLEKLGKILLAHCSEHLIKWSVPKAIEFRTELPTTKVGKVAYAELEKAEKAKVGSYNRK